MEGEWRRGFTTGSCEVLVKAEAGRQHAHVCLESSSQRAPGLAEAGLAHIPRIKSSFLSSLEGKHLWKERIPIPFRQAVDLSL